MKYKIYPTVLFGKGNIEENTGPSIICIILKESAFQNF